MSNALTVRPHPTVEEWHMYKEMAPVFHEARCFGVSNMAQAAAIIVKGHYLGFDPAASLEFIQVVDGKPTLSPRGMLAILHSHPECECIKIEDQADAQGNPTACTIYMKRKNGFEHTITFSIEDAKRAGLVKSGGNWEKYPANMLRWRAIGFCADVVFPDIIGGMKRADEFGANISPDGDVVEGTWQPVVEPPRPQPQPDPQPAQIEAKVSLNELVTKYGAEAIMAAAGGVIPGTDEQLAEVAAKLAEGEAQNA